MTSEDRSRRADRSVRVELEFLEKISLRCPDHVPTLKALADLYTHVGRYAEGLTVDLQLSEQCTDDPEVFYNLACSYALEKNREFCLQALGKAIELGYDNVDWMETDKDLESLWDDVEFERLCERIRAQIN